MRSSQTSFHFRIVNRRFNTSQEPDASRCGTEWTKSFPTDQTLLAHQTPTKEPQFLRRLCSPGRYSAGESTGCHSAARESAQLQFLRRSDDNLLRWGGFQLPAGGVLRANAAVHFRDGDALVIAAVVGGDDERLPLIVRLDQILVVSVTVIDTHDVLFAAGQAGEIKEVALIAHSHVQRLVRVVRDHGHALPRHRDSALVRTGIYRQPLREPRPPGTPQLLLPR